MVRIEAAISVCVDGLGKVTRSSYWLLLRYVVPFSGGGRM